MRLLILSSTNGVPESSWTISLLVYHGALNTVLSIFDCLLCMTWSCREIRMQDEFRM